MPRWSANVSMLFTELPFMDRFAAAKAAGFDAVECWSPYEHGVPMVARRLRALDLRMVCINTSPGGPQDFGLAAMPGREDDFVATLDQALDAARELGGCAVHVLGGTGGPGTPPATAWQTYAANLERAVRRADGSGVQLLIEALNSRDRPGYVLRTVDQAAQLIDGAGLSSTLKIMFDCYHVQVESGDLVTRLRRHRDRIGHIQFANAPGRNEPAVGEVDYRYVFDEIDRLGWDGWVGAEYRPAGGVTVSSLGWMRRDGAAVPVDAKGC